MFTFNRNEQAVLLMLSLALLVGFVVSYLDRNNTESISDFDVKKGAVPVPPMPQEQPEKATAPAQININSATAKDFETLQGIGPHLAQRIVDYRDQKGPFSKLEDLTKVSGIGSKTLERLRPQITLQTP